MTNASASRAPSASRVIVGIDGSEQSQQALAWAVDKSDRLGPVTPVAFYQPPRILDILTKPRRVEDEKTFRAAAEADLAAAIAATEPALADRARAIEGHAGPGLAALAEDADLLVVGTRGRSPVASVLLGSVSSHCVRTSVSPVAVIPLDFPADRPLSTIVVGVDGSANAEAALRWAIEHVEPDGKIYAAGALSSWGYMAGEFEPPLEVMENQVLATVEAAVSSTTGLDYRGPEIIIRVVAKDARLALPELATAEADLLIIGARGVTGIPHLILGSVASALIHDPAVPTLVIPKVNVPESEG